MTGPTVNGPTGPLGEGWHRVTWVQFDRPQYMVSESIESAVMVASMLETRGRANVRFESWSDYPCVNGVFVPQGDVPRETSAAQCTEGQRRSQCMPFHTDDCPYV
jgi:hypothetical protein